MQTRDNPVYENVAGVRQPPLVQIPDTHDPTAFEFAEALMETKMTRSIVRAAISAGGLHRFARKTGPELESLIRRHNLRLQILEAPLLSGTVALSSDPGTPCLYRRAASLIIATRSLQADVMSGQFPIGNEDGGVQELGQFPNLFGTTVVVDESGPRISKTHERDHVAVAVGGQFYRVHVGDAGIDELASCLEQLATSSLANQCASPAIVTCGSAPDQIQAFTEMRRHAVNVASLDRLQETLLTVCLDLDHSPPDEATAAALAHSGNLENRWYHSSLQIVVFGNAEVCAVCNFAVYLDGNVVTRACAELQRRAANVALAPSTGNQLPTAEPLNWIVADGGLSGIRDSVSEWRDEQQSTFSLEGFGTEFFRRHGLSPIPTFVVVLQRAANQLTGASPRINQFVSQANYRCMGLRTANVSTPEVVRAAGSLNGSQTESTQLRQLLTDAVRSQKRVCDAVRPFLRLEDLYLLLLASSRGFRFWRAWGAFAAAALAFRLLGRGDLRHDIMISHPRIYPETPLVGRPGVRLPYLRHFGLHYQIHADRAVLTIMPSTEWHFPNAELANAIEIGLRRLGETLSAQPADTILSVA